MDFDDDLCRFSVNAKQTLCRYGVDYAWSNTDCRCSKIYEPQPVTLVAQAKKDNDVQPATPVTNATSAVAGNTQTSQPAKQESQASTNKSKTEYCNTAAETGFLNSWS